MGRGRGKERDGWVARGMGTVGQREGKEMKYEQREGKGKERMGRGKEKERNGWVEGMKRKGTDGQKEGKGING